MFHAFLHNSKSNLCKLTQFDLQDLFGFIHWNLNCQKQKRRLPFRNCQLAFSSNFNDVYERLVFSVVKVLGDLSVFFYTIWISEVVMPFPNRYFIKTNNWVSKKKGCELFWLLNKNSHCCSCNHCLLSLRQSTPEGRG